ncbi:transmembrane protein 216 isoform X1 [Echeneis naucrates]|uniref:transmembrane protein 216 isoform X1 n=1 Tax=Echeneis naucrates TaxID=173247 RepID=UPI00111444AC|nr:transmembrane protein 216 isoform X1 [Echeneis naucrates]XP_029368048.1 transmembrane protein 216 isoform X1 [Echeneis naucrates]
MKWNLAATFSCSSDNNSSDDKKIAININHPYGWTSCLCVHAGVLLPYPSNNLVLDVVLLVIFLGLETLRIFYGWKGNLCERSLALCASLFMLFPCAALAVYYLLLQTFVLRLEFILSAILLCFYSLELLLGLLSVSAFSRSKVY